MDLVDDLPGLAALEHGDDEPLVLLGELAGVVADDVLDRLDLDPQGRAGTGHAAADAAAGAGLEDGGRGSRREKRPTRSTVAITPYDA